MQLIHADDFQKVGFLFHRFKDWFEGFSTGVCFQVRVEHVFPWFAVNRTGLELYQVDAVVGEYLQHFQQGPRLVAG